MSIIRTYGLLLLILIIFTSKVVQAQQQLSFVVYYVSGKCLKVSGSKSTTVKKGDPLLVNDNLIIPGGGSLLLICSNYNTVQLKTPGKYNIKQLLSGCSKPAQSASLSYFRFVWAEFTHPHKSAEHDPSDFMKTAGAVVRGRDRTEFTLNPDSIILTSKLAIMALNATDTITAVFYNSKTNRQLWTSKAAGKIEIDPIKYFKAIPGTYYWRNISGSNRDKNVLFYLAEEAYTANVEQLVKQVIATDPAQTAFMCAFLLEKNHYLGEAAKYYKKAVKLEPANTIYKSYNSRFYE